MNAAPPPGFWRARMQSFRHAWRGAVLLVRTQTNARVHLVASFLVVALGLWVQVTTGEWCALFLAMGLVWAAEAANTAIEALADRVNREWDERLGRAKDLAAGGVLLAALAAAAVGVIIFGPRFCAWWNRLPG